MLLSAKLAVFRLCEWLYLGECFRGGSGLVAFGGSIRLEGFRVRVCAFKKQVKRRVCIGFGFRV